MIKWTLRIIGTIIFIFILSAADQYAFGANSYQKALWSYPRDIQTTCKKLHSVRDRNAKYIDYKSAYYCAKSMYEDRKREEDRQLHNNLTKELTKSLRHNRLRW